LELYGGLDFDMTKVTASGGHSNAVGLRSYYDAVGQPSRFGMEIARLLRPLLQKAMKLV
jgi:hypothetical protein